MIENCCFRAGEIWLIENYHCLRAVKTWLIVVENCCLRAVKTWLIESYYCLRAVKTWYVDGDGGE